LSNKKKDGKKMYGEDSDRRRPITDTLSVPTRRLLMRLQRRQECAVYWQSAWRGCSLLGRSCTRRRVLHSGDRRRGRKGNPPLISTLCCTSRRTRAEVRFPSRRNTFVDGTDTDRRPPRTSKHGCSADEFIRGGVRGSRTGPSTRADTSSLVVLLTQTRASGGNPHSE